MLLQFKQQQLDFVGSCSQFPAYIAGVGCIDGNEKVNGIPVAEWSGGNVKTLFGEFDSTASWIKGVTDLYQVTTQSGKRVVVTLGHRFLTPTGWNQLEHLSVGALIACGAEKHDLQYEKRLQDSQDCYSSGSRLNGGLQPPAVAAYLDKLRQFHKTDGDSNASALCKLLSIDDFSFLPAPPDFSSSGQFSKDAYELPHPDNQNQARLSHKTLLRDNAPLQHPLECPERAVLNAFETDPYLLDNKCANVVSYWDNITEIKFVRNGQYYDLTVPAAEHYFASGIWNHNTGKSTALIAKALLHSKESPNNLGVIVRKQFTDLRNSTIKDFQDYTGLKVNESTHEVKLPNGSVILFIHGDVLDSLKNINCGWFGIEQAEEFADDTAFQFLKMRLRRKVEFRTGFLIGNAAGHNWIYNIYKKNGPPPNHELIEASTLDFADIHVPDYIENLKTLPDRLYRRYVLNSWDVTEGLVYDQWEDRRNVVEPFDIPTAWERGFVLDHGFRNPTAILWYAIDFDGNVILYDEHYQCEKPISFHAERIKERGLDGGWCDPSIFNKTQSKGGNIYSLADEYRECGVNLVSAVKEEEYARIARVNEMLKNGRIKAFSSLVNFRQEISNWKWKPQPSSQAGMNYKEEPEDRGNHLMDDLGYLIASRFPASSKPIPKPERKSFDWWKQMKDQQVA